MPITARLENQIHILDFDSTFVAENIGKLQTQMEPYLKDDKVTKLLLNFKNVDHIDSTGIGFLLEIRHAMIERKGKIGLFSINEYVRDIFDITNIDTLMNLYKDEAEAINDFS